MLKVREKDGDLLIWECTKCLGAKEQLVQLAPVWALGTAFTEITRQELLCTLAHTHTLIHHKKSATTSRCISNIAKTDY